LSTTPTATETAKPTITPTATITETAAATATARPVEVTRVVPFAYTVTPAGEVTAKGSIDMLDFALKDAHDSIHQTCEELHKGQDGVSRTWTDVDLTLTGKFTKSCA